MSMKYIYAYMYTAFGENLMTNNHSTLFCLELYFAIFSHLMLNASYKQAAVLFKS